MTENVSNYHMQYSDVTSQHWDESSEKFAGGDHLLTAMENGWKVAACEQVKHWYEGMRSVDIYRFSLQRDDQTIVMPVLMNPYVSRFIIEQGIDVIDKTKEKA